MNAMNLNVEAEPFSVIGQLAVYGATVLIFVVIAAGLAALLNRWARRISFKRRVAISALLLPAVTAFFTALAISQAEHLTTSQKLAGFKWQGLVALLLSIMGGAIVAHRISNKSSSENVTETFD